jgi:hypothetical protein
MERPPVGSEGEKTRSVYELRSASGQVLITAPSMLYDPKYASTDFENYNRRSDRISLHISSSGKSILIVEDRSPTFPCRAHILLQRQKNGTWSWTDLKVAAVREQGKEQSVVDVYGHYPEIAAINDTALFFQAGALRKQDFKDLPSASLQVFYDLGRNAPCLQE